MNVEWGLFQCSASAVREKISRDTYFAPAKLH